MRKLRIHLENCYGIKKLASEFDFSKSRACAIYAPNGAMKSSLAQTFQDLVNNVPTGDRVFPGRPSLRKITDDQSADVNGASVFVIRPYDEQFGHTEKTSTLLVDNALRQEYAELFAEIDSKKKLFLKALKDVSGSKKNLENEVSLTFTRAPDEFFRALIRIKEELITQQEAPLSSVPYDLIFDDKVLAFLNTKDFRTLLLSYIEKYNELLAASTYFKKGTFTYYNAETIAKSLANNGFFDANHSVSLNHDDRSIEIKNVKDLQDLIEKEKQQITNDETLRSRFAEIDKQVHGNINLREFHSYLLNNPQILPMLSNLDKLKEDLWKSYIWTKIDLYKDLLEQYQRAEKRKKEIEEAAAKQRTQWEAVIQIFNNRFFVPFKLTVRNRIPVMLGQEPVANLAFTFEDGAESAPVERDALLKVLSTGERKALYVLNIIFEVEARKKSAQPTLFIVDDIADSFDYKNKYAIIEYLKDISEEKAFRQLILTHNFDFFRTIHSRFVGYGNCLMAIKTEEGVSLTKAAGIKNVFVKDWKPNFFTDKRKRIASIPFLRNMIEYTKGEMDPHYLKLTSLLHWKFDSSAIKQAELDAIFNSLFTESGSSGESEKPVIEVLLEAARECLSDAEGINFENKIVLSIAIRLCTEQFVIKEMILSTEI